MLNTYQLFLGRDIPSGGTVTDEMMQEFIASTLDTTFDGYTLQAVDGVWKGIHEDTTLVSVCTDRKDLVLKVAKVYKNKFHQDSVAIQQLPAMDFV